MIAELGHFALVLALVCAGLQALLPLLGSLYRIQNWQAVARPAAQAQFLCLAAAMAALIHAFITHDFSVAYVAHNSNTKLPLLYRVSAVWGAHEGSLLLWAFVLSAWSLSVSLFSRSIPSAMVARVLSVMGLISIGFLLFMLMTSNPFDRLFPIPIEGRDLNPLLQDVGLAIHPPMLYMGYVGFSVAFAFAIAAMWSGRLDAAWARWSRPWTSVAWLFLTLGIALGSWWAYYELGWGGWWFWDPVENASFMPWLVGTALLHSLAITDKRSSFKAWTALLAIFAFSLSLLGTFLVRSGVLTSVHSFASDPERGLYILAFLALVVGGSLFLFTLRAPQIRTASRFDLLSRETALLINNIILVVLATSILGGTLFPIITVALDLGKYSVGFPFFNFVFVLLTIPLAMVMGVGQLLRWKEDNFARIRKPAAINVAISVVLALIVTALMPEFSVYALLGLLMAFWIGGTTVTSFIQRYKNKGITAASLRSTPLGFYGQHVAHLGAMVFCIGITLTSIYSSNQDVLLKPGENHTMDRYVYRFDGARPITGPNYSGYEGDIVVSRDGNKIVELKPQKRVYFSQNNPMTEAAIDAGVTRDLFVALGEPRGSEGAWTLRLYHKPFIRWIWFGAVLMALGGLLSTLDIRYRRLARQKAASIPASSAVQTR